MGDDQSRDLPGDFRAKNLTPEQMTPRFFEDIGYEYTRRLADGRIIGIARMRLSMAIHISTGIVGESYRYLYNLDHTQDAINDVQNWDGTGDPPGLWVKKKGKDFDILNPRWEAQPSGIPRLAEAVIQQDEMQEAVRKTRAKK